MTIKIYKPAKTAMQAGNKNTKKWCSSRIFRNVFICCCWIYVAKDFGNII